MNGRSATAPGKVMLSGEYAVLSGAPAIVAAVDRRARVHVQPSAHADTGLVTTTGDLTGQWRYSIADRGRPGEIRWLDALPAPRAFALVERVLEVAGPACPLQLHLDTVAFAAADGGGKLGLGSSAALAVALTAALGARDVALASRAHEAHRRFQGGEGSGADVACALAGGIIVYRRESPSQTKQLAWPGGLQSRVLWSGRAASTTAGIARLRQGLAGGRAGAEFEHLGIAAQDTATAWETGASAAVLARLADYVHALRALSDSHDLGIFSSGHARLSELATSRGIVYKPCGAGGGDVGAAFATDTEALQDFVELATVHGFTPLNLAMGAHGVRLGDGTDQ